MTGFMCSAVPVEQSLNAYERHQDAQPEVSDKEIEAVADFIEVRLLRDLGRLSKAAERAHDLHAEAMADAVDEKQKGADETVAAFLGRLALTDAHEAGTRLQALSRRCIEQIADDHYDEFAPEARAWGCIE